MRVKYVTVALIVGISMSLGPWILIDKPSKNWFWFSVLGMLLASVAGYNAQAGMIGLGEPGEDLLQSWWKAIKEWFTKNA